MFDDEVVTGDTPVPFGKYKGQPCSVLLADNSYREWVLTQAGIVEKYPAVIAFLCEGEQHSSTPAHNALQAKLLDQGFALSLGWRVTPGHSRGWRVGQFEYMGFDAVLVGEVEHTYREGDIYWRQSLHVVECKPSLSDDYPAVLRQMQTAQRVALANKKQFDGMTLLVGSFKSAAIDLDQVKAFFRLSRIGLVTVDEVEGARLV